MVWSFILCSVILVDSYSKVNTILPSSYPLTVFSIYLPACFLHIVKSAILYQGSFGGQLDSQSAKLILQLAFQFLIADKARLIYSQKSFIYHFLSSTALSIFSLFHLRVFISDSFKYLLISGNSGYSCS